VPVTFCDVPFEVAEEEDDCVVEGGVAIEIDTPTTIHDAAFEPPAVRDVERRWGIKERHSATITG
jgi:hypothetical protein